MTQIVDVTAVAYTDPEGEEMISIMVLDNEGYRCGHVFTNTIKEAETNPRHPGSPPKFPATQIIFEATLTVGGRLKKLGICPKKEIYFESGGGWYEFEGHFNPYTLP